MKRHQNKLTVYRSFTKATEACLPGQPILRVGMEMYIVGADKLTQVEVIGPDGSITGQVGLGHLDRLGNANGAKPDPNAYGNASKRTAFGPDYRYPEEKPYRPDPAAEAATERDLYRRAGI